MIQVSPEGPGNGPCTGRSGARSTRSRRFPGAAAPTAGRPV